MFFMLLLLWRAAAGVDGFVTVFTPRGLSHAALCARSVSPFDSPEDFGEYASAAGKGVKVLVEAIPLVGAVVTPVLIVVGIMQRCVY
jgi:hypothetical protein